MTYQISKLMTFALISVLLYVTVSVTLPIIAGNYIISTLGGSRDLAHYMVCFYAFGYALGLPLVKPLLKKMSPRKALMGCFLLFGIMMILCAAAQSYYQLVIARFIQGMIGGPLLPLATNMLLYFIPAEKKHTLVKYMLAASVIAPVLGTTFGGVIAYAYHWRLIFLLPIPIIVGLSLLFFHHLQDEPIPTPTTGFNVIGYLLFFLSIFCLGTATTLGQYLDWNRSTLIVSLFTVGGLSLILYLLFDIGHPSPVLDLSLFKRLHFSMAMVYLSVLFGSYLGLIIMLGFWLTFDVTFTTWWILLLLGHMFIAAGVLFTIVDKMARIDMRIWLALSIVLFIYSAAFAKGFSVEIDFWRLATARTTAGFSLALFVYSLSNISSQNMNPIEKYEQGITFHVFRCLGIGLGTSIFSTVLLRRSVFFHERLGSQLTSFSVETKMFFYKAGLINLKGAAAQAELLEQLDTQANALALNDTFYLLMWVSIALLVILIMTLFIKRDHVQVSST